MEKPFSQACENNKTPILEIIKEYFGDVHDVLEIGSGTGQHAVHFAKHLPHLVWQTSDQQEYHDGIRAWLNDYSGSNLLPPLTLDVTKPWPVTKASAVFSANTSHIMSWAMVQNFFEGVSQVLRENGYFCLYGPFNFCGEYTSDSNEAFDAHLKARDPAMGLRDFVDLEELAQKVGLCFVDKHDMPANNFILVWQKPIRLMKSDLDI